MNNLKNIKNVLSFLLLTIVFVTSSIGLWTSTTPWGDTIYTCLWCLSIVMLTDKIDKHW